MHTVREFTAEELWTTFYFVTPKSGRFYTKKVATEEHRFVANKEA